MIIRFGRVEWRKKLWLERRKETKRPRERGEEKELEVKRKSRIDGSEGSRCIFERVDEWEDEYSGGVKRRKETEKKRLELKRQEVVGVFIKNGSLED